MRLYCAEDRRAHLRGHWVDAVSLSPASAASGFSGCSACSAWSGSSPASTASWASTSGSAQNRGLLLLLLVWLGVVVVSSLAFFAAEVNVNDNVSTPVDALWWGVVTLTTVGYGDILPVTWEGRLAAIVLMVLGIGLFSAITATVTSALIGGEATREDPTVRMDRLDAFLAAGRVTGRSRKPSGCRSSTNF